MFDSGITATSLISDLKSEVDVSTTIPNKTYIMWLNSLEQLLYSEFIKEQKTQTITSSLSNNVTITTINHATDESQARFEDIIKIVVDGVEFSKTNINNSKALSNVYFKTSNNIGLSTAPTSSIEFVYCIRPAFKIVDGSDVISTASGIANVMVPYEFIDLVKAKLRGEAYKLVNEDAIAAKWLNDYNALLDNFKNWIASKKSSFGI